MISKLLASGGHFRHPNRWNPMWDGNFSSKSSIPPYPGLLLHCAGWNDADQKSCRISLAIEHCRTVCHFAPLSRLPQVWDNAQLSLFIRTSSHLSILCVYIFLECDLLRWTKLNRAPVQQQGIPPPWRAVWIQSAMTAVSLLCTIFVGLLPTAHLCIRCIGVLLHRCDRVILVFQQRFSTPGWFAM